MNGAEFDLHPFGDTRRAGIQLFAVRVTKAIELVHKLIERSLAVGWLHLHTLSSSSENLAVSRNENAKSDT